MFQTKDEKGTHSVPYGECFSVNGTDILGAFVFDYRRAYVPIKS